METFGLAFAKALVTRKGAFTHPVYPSHLPMRLPHCIAFFITYLGLLMSTEKSYYFENATQCRICMRKLDVATWLNK